MIKYISKVFTEDEDGFNGNCEGYVINTNAENLPNFLSEYTVNAQNIVNAIKNIKDETLRKIAETSNGDVRTALNGLEVAVLSTQLDKNGVINITDEIAKLVVSNANAKEFIGKDEVKSKRDLNSINKTFVKKDNKEIKENNKEEDWDSF